ncbi:DUF1840 family protein [Pseudohongiella nitratireducens]|uniref:DUF1840 family protein n=1 Tax=Pseudohongiella nitratireducens TaxID=1768907 RepID=UPI0030EE9138|tara:strand:+ start:7635 stop:7982 length:348 start_codon:yes stop_codon:yes gene_type:complete
MLIKFYSEESAEFVMLDSTADQLLTMMGHGGSTEGSVSGEALASAMDRLTSAMAREQDKSPASTKADENQVDDEWDEDEDSDSAEEVTLSARAAPLMTMLRRARDSDGYVMWRPD